jgi:phenylalanyl-tRNA synthetase alpha chain
LQEQLKELVKQAETDIQACVTANDLMNAKAQYLGKKSVLNGLFARMKELSPEERPAFGNMINQSRTQIEALLEIRSKQVKEQAWMNNSNASSYDLSMPGIESSRGGFHPLTIVRREIDEVFLSMGFEIAEGPDIDDDFHNFDALNTPADHPSRNLADTFYLENGGLLRTQTSTVQIRTMERYAPPIRIISPGRCYRNDKPDPSHSPVFIRWKPW